MNKKFFNIALEENIVGCLGRLSKEDRKKCIPILSGLPEQKKDRIRYLLTKRKNLTLT